MKQFSASHIDERARDRYGGSSKHGAVVLQELLKVTSFVKSLLVGLIFMSGARWRGVSGVLQSNALSGEIYIMLSV